MTIDIGEEHCSSDDFTLNVEVILVFDQFEVPASANDQFVESAQRCALPQQSHERHRDSALAR